MALLTIRNESDVDLMAVLSQLTALHWKNTPIKPGESAEFNCGRVWFTVSVNGFDEKKLPTKMGTAGRLTGIVAATLFFPGPMVVPLALTGMLSRATSNYSKNNRAIGVKGCYENGVYADGKVIVIKGMTRPDGVYQVYIDRYENQRAVVTKAFAKKASAPAEKDVPVAVAEVDDNKTPLL